MSRSVKKLIRVRVVYYKKKGKRKMLLKEWKTKPFNNGLYLLGKQNLDEFNGIRMWHDKDIPKQDKLVCVYNTETDRVSDKSVYIDVDGREYIKNKNEKCYLDEFKCINSQSAGC